jgi:hypothetical protein
MDFSDIGDESIDSTGPPEGEAEIVDMRNEGRNAIALAFLDGFYTQVRDLHSELVEERKEADGDNLTMEISFNGFGMKTYQIHSLAVSYYEAGTPLLSFHHLHNSTEDGEKILEWMNDNREFIFDENSEDSRSEQTMNWLNSDRSSITDIANLLYETGILEHDKIKRVRTQRNNFLHSPLKMLSIADWNDIISMSEKCLEATDALDQRMIEDIDLHGTYGSFTDRDRNRNRY